MAAKRKHYVSLGLASLYDDLDSTSNDAESSNNVTKLADNDNNDNDDDKVLSAKKLKEDMKSDMAERFNASNLGAGRWTIASFSFKARFSRLFLGCCH